MTSNSKGYYVDLDLLDMLIIDSIDIFDVNKKTFAKIDFNATGSTENDTVTITGTYKPLDLCSSETVSVSDFENMLLTAIEESEFRLLEEVDEFKKIQNNIIDELIRNLNDGKHFYVNNKATYEFTDGIGFIKDTRKNLVIGTFDELLFNYSKRHTSGKISYSIVPTRHQDELDNLRHTDYEYSYYSIRDKIVYKLSSPKEVNVISFDYYYNIDVSSFDISTSEFDTNDELYEKISKEKSFKNILDDTPINDPLYELNKEKLITNRLEFLEGAEDEYRKNKIAEQFSDIQIDL